MLASLLIIGFSLILLVYWFRYSCILMLRNSSETVAENSGILGSRFSIAQVQERLKSGLELDPLSRSLDRDYQVISYLLAHAPSLGSQSVEERLLVWDYRLMKLCYRIAKPLAPLHARRALAEMASVLGVLAQKIGQQAGVRSEA